LTCERNSREENPRKWIRRLQGINRCLGDIDPTHEHDDAEMTAETFLKLPKSNSEFVASCDLKRGTVGDLEDMIKDLGRFYKQTVEIGERNTNKRQKNATEKNVFFATDKKRGHEKTDAFVNCSKAFRGLCKKCGKIGHEQIDCKVRPENYEKAHKTLNDEHHKTNEGHQKTRYQTTADKTNKKCFACNNMGHFARDCPANNNLASFVGCLEHVVGIPDEARERLDSYQGITSNNQWIRQWHGEDAQCNGWESGSQDSMSSVEDTLMRVAIFNSIASEQERLKRLTCRQDTFRTMTEFEERRLVEERRIIDDVMAVSAFTNGHENLTVFNRASDPCVDFFAVIHEDEDSVEDSIEAMLGEMCSVGACAAVSVSDPMSISVEELSDLEDEHTWEHLRANDDWPEAWNTNRNQQVQQDNTQHNDPEEQDSEDECNDLHDDPFD
jgi:hypothetical protein